MSTRDEARDMLQGAILASSRQFEWTPGKQPGSHSWRIKTNWSPEYVHVWVDQRGTRFCVSYIPSPGKAKYEYCDNPSDAVALAERISLEDSA